MKIEAMHGKEWYNTGACIDAIIIGKLYYLKLFDLIILLVVNINSKIPL